MTKSIQQMVSKKKHIPFILTLMLFVQSCNMKPSSSTEVLIPIKASEDTTKVTELEKFPLGPFVRDDLADRLGAKPSSVFFGPISEKPVNWEEKDLLCAAAVVKHDKVYMLYRAEDRSRGDSWGTSRIGLAISEDGRRFERHPSPVLYPENDFMKKYEWEGGCQDPRLAETDDGTYVMTYTSFDGKIARLSIATSKDLYSWTKHGLAFGSIENGKYQDFWSKSGSIVCVQKGERFVAKKINGKYWMYFGDSFMYIATSDDLKDWDILEDEKGKPLEVLPSRSGKFDETIREPGPQALLTDKGILLIYNGGTNGRPDLGLEGTVWSVGQALFDPGNPAKLLKRTDNDIFHPERDFEIGHQGGSAGGNSNVTFVESLIWFNNEWRFYYGSADSFVASAVYRPEK